MARIAKRVNSSNSPSRSPFMRRDGITISSRLQRKSSTATIWRMLRSLLCLMALALTAFTTPAATQVQVPPTKTSVVLLGTGTPNADPDRWGPAVAVVVDDQSYLIDAGPGIVRRANAAARDRMLPPLRPANLRRVFVTHLHSDHTLGLP